MAAAEYLGVWISDIKEVSASAFDRTTGRIPSTRSQDFKTV